MFKQRVYGLLAAELFIYVYDGRPRRPTEILCWESSRRLCLTCSWLGIRDASRKFQPPSQAPVTWADNINNTEGGLHVLVSQEIWDNTCMSIAELAVMEQEGRYGMYRARMESIRGF